MPDPMRLPAPLLQFENSERALRESFTRPLTKRDYYEARVRPKDAKHLDDLFFGGMPYLCRHATRNWKADRKKTATVQIGLLPVSVVLWGLNAFLITAPALSVFFGQRLLPFQPRSEAATREDAIGRAIYAFSRTVSCFAGTRQYHDSNGQREVAERELSEIHGRSDALLNDLRKYIETAEPRINQSSSLAMSIDYLYGMVNVLARRRIQRH
jgi:hypothetical protein